MRRATDAIRAPAFLFLTRDLTHTVCTPYRQPAEWRHHQTRRDWTCQLRVQTPQIPVKLRGSERPQIWKPLPYPPRPPTEAQHDPLGPIRPNCTEQRSGGVPKSERRVPSSQRLEITINLSRVGQGRAVDVLGPERTPALCGLSRLITDVRAQFGHSGD